MIKQTLDNDVFLEICDKLREVKNCKITANLLYGYMISGQISKDVLTLVSYDKDKMNGCVVAEISRDEYNGDLILFMMFIWINAHFPKLLQEFIEFTNNKAKELNIKQIVFATDRNEKIIERRIGKHGFKKFCSVFKKDVI